MKCQCSNIWGYMWNLIWNQDVPKVSYGFLYSDLLLLNGLLEVFGTQLSENNLTWL